ncbi:MAG TPA: peptidogalycan biosysnthesis protein, partial [Ottowia sp.]|uniref:peptidogalycan biosysnthesis protein n=1 Tax=Ottowia sp. TaxID=1898956 RepID=UPI002B68EC3C
MHGNAPRAAGHAGWRLEIAADPTRIDAARWDALLARQATPTPFMRHAYLAALHASGSAAARTGWTPQYLLLWDGDALAAACPLYLKEHSYGEYVFDWAWANAYAEHGLAYYPKALVAVPFTPVPGSRLLARDAPARAALLQALLQACTDNGLSSLHVLYGDDTDVAACEDTGLMLRQQVQFHWKNMKPPRSAAAPAALPPEGA